MVLHHRAGDGDAEGIHKLHKDRGYSGIGYHFYVRKDGKIYQGRPIETVGAHTLGANQKSIGICFEGDFEKEMATLAPLEPLDPEKLGDGKLLIPQNAWCGGQPNERNERRRYICLRKRFASA